MCDYTVLATQNDPYRCDTPAGHRDAQWFLDQFRATGRQRIHLRGLHYAIVSAEKPVLKPNGKAYTNTDADWLWLQNSPSKRARWLGYVPFDAITDERNMDPIIRELIHTDHFTGRPSWYVTGGLFVHHEMSSYEFTFVPALGARPPRQPFRLVLFGEKSSLREGLLPIANRYDADLFLPTGEISDTQMYMMAKAASEDGRPLRVFTLSDFDPAGWQMPISIGRKLQALKDCQFPDLDFEVRPVGLTWAQTQELGLPSTPLKESERRRHRWLERFGVEQTEIDALVTLRPTVFRQMVDYALGPFVDRSIDWRHRAAVSEWHTEAERRLEDAADHQALEALNAKLAGVKERIEEARARIDEATAEADAIRREAGELVVDVDLPPFDGPSIELDESRFGEPIVSTDWSWGEQTERLIARKEYENHSVE